MHQFDVFAVMAMLILGIYLLHQVSQKLNLNKWLTPLNLGWILASLLWLMSYAEAGSKGALALSYLLIGILIINTLVLFLCSRLPNRFVSLKSTEIELIGSTLLKLLGTGLREVGRNLLLALFKMIDEILEQRQTKLARLNGI